MKNIILTMLTTLVVAGCGGSSGGSGAGNVAPGADSGTGEMPVSIDVTMPTTEVPRDEDELQACVAIDAVTLTDLAGTIVEWTTRSMENPEEINSEYSGQCIPADSSVPIDNDGYPKFIVIDLYNVTGIDLVSLISEQLVPVGEYTSIALSVLQGDYGDFFKTPYSYVGNPLDAAKNEIVEDLKFEGLNINIDVPETFTMAFEFRSMFEQVEKGYRFKEKAVQLVTNTLSGSIFGDIDTSSCPSVDDAYVYLYESDDEQEKYGDLGSDEYTPVMTAKVTEGHNYAMPYVPAGEYDVVLVCDGLLDLPDQIDLDIDLDGDASKYTDQHLDSGEDKYLPL